MCVREREREREKANEVNALRTQNAIRVKKEWSRDHPSDGTIILVSVNERKFSAL